MMGIIVPETCWAYKKYNKIISGRHLVGFYSSDISDDLDRLGPSMGRFTCSVIVDCDAGARTGVCTFVFRLETGRKVAGCV